MSVYKNLSIKGASLEKGQLNEYIEKTAQEHLVAGNSDISTYPIPRLRENFEFISKTYKLLSEHLKLGIKIHSAGEWILDNFYIIEECVQNIEKSLSAKKYKKFISISSGRYKGFARSYVLASEIVGFTDFKVTEEILVETLGAYQKRQVLSMEEIWNIGIFMQIALIQNIRDICEKIYYVQIQKYKVENIFERLVENKEKRELIFQKDIKEKYIFSYRDLKYPFIEYMLYKLRRTGKRGSKYIEVLEEQVKMMGTTVSDIVLKEHFYVATLKVSIGNCIRSIKNINRINFQEIFEKINKTEEILNSDPAGVFKNMTHESKDYYRNVIKKISNKTKISEIYIAEKVLELASKNRDGRKSHIGYYLIDDGKEELMHNLTGTRKKKVSLELKSKIYVGFILISSLVSGLLFTALFRYNIFFKILIFITILIPISEIILRVLNYVIGKCVKPKILPKINFEENVDKENSTFIVIPTILNSLEKIDELVRKLEVYYIANKSENLYFGILGDCTTSDREKEEFDKNIVEHGLKRINELNERYGNKNIFHFLYRKRTWNTGEKKYLGWERKRGLLTQFNKYVLYKDNSDFIANTLKTSEFKEKIKYIITLDSDTNLSLGTARELIGAMAHPLNKPIMQNGIVVKGYSLMQPRVGIDLLNSRASLFCKIFSGLPGIDFYSSSISNLYQDEFEEGIFTGKGIYEVEVYDKLLSNEIPENRVLSHDLLEGCYLRCALLNDVCVFDGYPSKFISYLERENRWIRGDWQIASWIKNKKINFLSKFKIFDNLRRSLLPIFELIVFFTGIILNNVPLVLISIISILIMSIIETINYIVFKESTIEGAIYADKKFNNEITGVRGGLLRAILEISFLPTLSYNSIVAISKTLYRLRKKEKLLEWTTSEEAEKKSKNSIESYCSKMWLNIILGAICFGFLNPFVEVIGTLWVLGPFIAWYLSKDRKEIRKIDEMDREYLLDIAKETWNFFEISMNEKNNYFPSDNYQEDRKEKFVSRTSSTNIGLGMLAVISSYDLGIITKEKAYEILEKMIEKIEALDKWNGHLYNWYNTESLKPLSPRYISTVDSGNFVGYLYIVKSFLKDNKNLIERIDNIINQTDFSKLYSSKNRLFSIGFNIEENKLTDSYYDFLASEARQASFVSIAKKDVSPKHWNNLSRTLTSLNGYKGLISWSGTAFEYLMPNINIKNYKGSLLDESARFLIMSQKEYAKRLGIPWGISESAFNLKDLNLNYQYKAFGVPNLGLKRGLEDEIVVSPYSSFLSLEYEETDAIKNLKKLENYNMRGKFGFYESIDFTKERLRKDEKYAVVKTYMAHHQGLILLSINNYLNKNILQKRFYENPEIEAIDILLHERMPNNIVLKKDNKNKNEKIKYSNDFSDKEINYTESEVLTRLNVISNQEYTVYLDSNGRGYSKYKDIIINRFKETDDEIEGIGFFVKNIRDNKIWTSFEKNKIKFLQSKNEIIHKEGNIEIILTVGLDPSTPTEIRRLKIKNIGNREEILEVTSFLEAILSAKLQDYAHPIFNNMFLKLEYIPEDEVFIIYRKEKNTDIYLGVKILCDNRLGKLEFETDKERFLGRYNTRIPQLVKNSNDFSSIIRENIEPVLGIKNTIKVSEKDEVCVDLILSVSENKENVIKRVKELSNKNEITNLFNLAKARTDEEIKYLGINGEKIETYEKMLGHLVYQSNITSNQSLNKYYMGDIWKHGISGDNPILLIEIKNIEDLYVVDEALEAIEFYKTRNTRIDLCILNMETVSYNQLVREGIFEVIRNHQMDYLFNYQIFVLNQKEIEKKDINTIRSRANLIFNAENGGLKVNLEELEDINKKKLRKVIRKESNFRDHEEISDNKLIKVEELQKYNGIGGFSDNGTEYIIEVSNDKRPPRPWVNIIANENFGTVITENFGGYTWDKNCRLKRITRWSNNTITDSPSEAIFIKENEKLWSVGNRLKTNQNYYVTHGMGYSIFKQLENDILHEVTVFIPINSKTKVNIIHLKNLSRKKRKIKLYYTVDLVLGEDEAKTIGNIITKQKDNKIICKNLCQDEFDKDVFIESNRKIESYTNNKKESIIDKVEDEFEINDGISYGNYIGVMFDIELDEFGEDDIIITLSTKDEQYVDKMLANKALEDVKKYWKEKTNILKVKTPSEDTNILLNSWIVYQTMSSRIFARSGFYQSGGAIGFRDQLQDCLGMKFIDYNLLRNQIIKCCRHQFIEGDVLHWWHEETGRGIRTRFSDDLLWLPYSIIEYIDFTGDYEILNIEVEYLEGENLRENVDEKYDLYLQGDKKESIFMHAIRAIEKSINFGEHGLPKIGSGDWNDGFSTVGNKGRGESVWLGFFLYDILNRFNKILEFEKADEYIRRYDLIKKELKKSLNNNGWDGLWFRRAYTDKGEILGSIESPECKIDSISQSWSIISDAADNDKKYHAINSLESYLIDRQTGIIKLLTPAFSKSDLEPGYIKRYPEGIRENGGQYTHAAIWAIIAFAKLGFGDKAQELFEMISPINHSDTLEKSNIYKIEPYVISADIYSNPDMSGRGGWSWYTGSSSWYYKAGIEYILGLQINNGKMRFSPCIKSDWKEYEIKYRYKSSVYEIKVYNPDGKNSGVIEVKMDGVVQENQEVTLRDDGEEHFIEIYI